MQSLTRTYVWSSGVAYFLFALLMLNFTMSLPKKVSSCTRQRHLLFRTFSSRSRTMTGGKWNSESSFDDVKSFLFNQLFHKASIKFTAFWCSFHFHSSPSENDLMFHFFGVESDSTKVREAINKMVEKGRIGNFSLVSTHFSLHQEPGLVLQVRLFIFVHRL